MLVLFPCPKKNPPTPDIKRHPLSTLSRTGNCLWSLGQWYTLNRGRCDEDVRSADLRLKVETVAWGGSSYDTMNRPSEAFSHLISNIKKREEKNGRKVRCGSNRGPIYQIWKDQFHPKPILISSPIPQLLSASWCGTNFLCSASSSLAPTYWWETLLFALVLLFFLKTLLLRPPWLLLASSLSLIVCRCSGEGGSSVAGGAVPVSVASVWFEPAGTSTSSASRYHFRRRVQRFQLSCPRRPSFHFKKARFSIEYLVCE